MKQRKINKSPPQEEQDKKESDLKDKRHCTGSEKDIQSVETIKGYYHPYSWPSRSTNEKRFP